MRGSSAVASHLRTKPLVAPLGLWIVGTVRHPGLAFAFVERMRDWDRLAIDLRSTRDRLAGRRTMFASTAFELDIGCVASWLFHLETIKPGRSKCIKDSVTGYRSGARVAAGGRWSCEIGPRRRGLVCAHWIAWKTCAVWVAKVMHALRRASKSTCEAGGGCPSTAEWSIAFLVDTPRRPSRLRTRGVAGSGRELRRLSVRTPP